MSRAKIALFVLVVVSYPPTRTPSLVRDILFDSTSEENLMTRFHRVSAFAFLVTALGISVGIYAQQKPVANTSSNAAASVTNDALRRAGAVNDAFPGAWLSYGRTQGETRYSPLKQIDATNA